MHHTHVLDLNTQKSCKILGYNIKFISLNSISFILFKSQVKHIVNIIFFIFTFRDVF